jgi:hypothetical protein
MTIATLANAARRNVVLFSAAFADAQKRIEQRDGVNGVKHDVLVVEDLPVFRSGVFRDSMGFQHTWEPLHIDQMKANYDLLTARGYMPDVPVRRDHPGFLTNVTGDVIGHHTGLRTETRTNPVDGSEQNYLLATFDVTDPGAMDKISRGTWRNVSAEVGSWLTNNETEFWPTYQGVAYVDVSAVEGLKSFSNHNGVGKQFSLMLDGDDKEDAVTAPVLANTNPATPAAPAAPTDAAYHGRANFQFTIAGQPTNDFAKVQAHITSIEGQNATFAAAQAEAKESNRKAFIKGLAEGSTPKILASQIESIEGYALKLDDDGWTAFTKSYETVPALSTVSQHANATSLGQQVNLNGQTPVPTQQNGAEDQVEIWAGTVDMHSRSGMKADQIKATPSFKKLQAAKPDHPVLAKIA